MLVDLCTIPENTVPEPGMSSRLCEVSKVKGHQDFLPDPYDSYSLLWTLEPQFLTLIPLPVTIYINIYIPVVPHKAVADVSEIGNL